VKLDSTLFPSAPRSGPRAPLDLRSGRARATLAEIEMDAILRTLEATGGSTSRAAAILEISRGHPVQAEGIPLRQRTSPAPSRRRREAGAPPRLSRTSWSCGLAARCNPVGIAYVSPATTSSIMGDKMNRTRRVIRIALHCCSRLAATFSAHAQSTWAHEYKACAARATGDDRGRVCRNLGRRVRPHGRDRRFHRQYDRREAGSFRPARLVKVLHVVFARSGQAVQEAPDGGLIVAGYATNDSTGARDAFLLRLDAGGSVSWTEKFAGLSTADAKDVFVTPDGGIALAGRINDRHGWRSSIGRRDRVGEDLRELRRPSTLRAISFRSCSSRMEASSWPDRSCRWSLRGALDPLGNVTWARSPRRYGVIRSVIRLAAGAYLRSATSSRLRSRSTDLIVKLARTAPSSGRSSSPAATRTRRPRRAETPEGAYLVVEQQPDRLGAARLDDEDRPSGHRNAEGVPDRSHDRNYDADIVAVGDGAYVVVGTGVKALRWTVTATYSPCPVTVDVTARPRPRRRDFRRWPCRSRVPVSRRHLSTPYSPCARS